MGKVLTVKKECIKGKKEGIKGKKDFKGSVSFYWLN